MKMLFWFSFYLIFFTYIGYPAFLFLRARFWPRPVLRGSIFPKVTIVMAVRNEEAALPRKLRNLEELDYPKRMLDVIVVSDGSTDRTNEILRDWNGLNHESILLPDHRGKASALNCGITQARGEIVCFVDARQTIARDGLRKLVENFADLSVGCASGQLNLTAQESANSCDGIGQYWRLEKRIRAWEGVNGSTVGATGAFYAARKDLILPLPEGTILDDVYIPLHIVRQGKRVVFDASAVAWDNLPSDQVREFPRKVRTLVGNYQMLRLAPWVLTTHNPVRLRWICHKLLRLLVPFALLGLLWSTLWIRQGFYELALIFQIGFYALAALASLFPQFGLRSRLADMAIAFIVLNTAAAVALVYFIAGEKVAWAR